MFILRKYFIYSLFVAPLSAGVSGSITDSNGRAVAGARIVFVQSPTVSSARSLPVQTIVTADLQGQYSKSLPSGSYIVCATGADEDSYLRSCEWGGGEAQDVVDGQAYILNLTLRESTKFYIVLKDPQGLLDAQALSASTAATARAPIMGGPLVGVKDANRKFHSTRLVSWAAGIATYLITLPAGITPTLWIVTDALSISDVNGNRVDIGSRDPAVSQNLASSTILDPKQSESIIVSITGRK